MPYLESKDALDEWTLLSSVYDQAMLGDGRTAARLAADYYGLPAKTPVLEQRETWDAIESAKDRRAMLTSMIAKMASRRTEVMGAIDMMRSALTQLGPSLVPLADRQAFSAEDIEGTDRE